MAVHKLAGKLTTLPIDQIVQLPDLQMRAGGVSADHVEDLKEALKKPGGKLPRVIVYQVPDRGNVLVDGYHTTAAHQALGRVEIACQVFKGTWEQAVLAAAGANTGPTHQALKRTRKDQRKAVLAVMEIQPRLAAAAVAKIVGCSDQLVLNMKREIREQREKEAAGEPTLVPEPGTVITSGGKEVPATRPDLAGKSNAERKKAEPEPTSAGWRSTPLSPLITMAPKVEKALEKYGVTNVGELLDAVAGGNHFGLKATEVLSLVEEAKAVKPPEVTAPEPAVNGAAKKQGADTAFPWADFHTNLGRVIRYVDEVPHHFPEEKQSKEYKDALGYINDFAGVAKRWETRLKTTEKASV